MTLRRVSIGSLASVCLASFAFVAPARAGLTGEAVRRLGASAVDQIARAGRSRKSVSALVTLRPSDDARALGLVPVTDTFAILGGDSATIAGFAIAHPELPIDIAPPLRTKLDEATPYVGATAMDTGDASAGAGTYVGVVDTGLDIFHPDFLDANGHTRIAYFLDMSVASGCADTTDLTNATDLKYCGHVYTRADLDALISADNHANAPTDVDGHGTHVTGIAAGDGRASSGKYVGVAPGADLVIVRAARGDDGNIDPTDAVLGVKFVFDMATADGKAAVANMSLGSQFGAHDGNSDFELALAALAEGPGRAIVVAAGNEGAYAIHTSVDVTDGGTVALPIQLPGTPAADKTLTEDYLSASVYAWVTWRDGASFTVALDGPDGSVWMSPVDPGQAFESNPIDGITVQVIDDLVGPTIPTGTHGAVITWSQTVSSSGVTSVASFPRGDYKLVLTGSGVLDAYLEGTGQASEGPSQPVFSAGSTIEGTISIPASSTSVISVGCSQLRSSYVDSTGALEQVKYLVPGARCGFSSAGPSSTGAMRPDILAPGQFIISSRSSDAVIGDSEFNQQSLVDAEHAVLEGTSMSTPFVTGATATLFAHDGTLTQEDARALLQAGAQPTAPDPNGAFFGEGAGILNVQRSLQALAARAAPTTATHLALHVGDSFLPTEGGLAVGFVATATDDAGTPADLAGTPSLTPTGATVSTALTHPAPGLYRFALAASADGSPRTASVTLASGDGTVSASTSLPVGADRWDALYGLTMGGGCDLSRRDRGLNSTAFAIAALALAGARRRRDLRRARAHCE